MARPLPAGTALVSGCHDFSCAVVAAPGGARFGRLALRCGLLCLLAGYSARGLLFPAAAIVVRGKRLGNRREARIHLAGGEDFLSAR